ncbi:MAG: glycerate kinase [Nitrosomonas sp.]|nr:MAG: glycerate kinase [Nitrosomonas sp.]
MNPRKLLLESFTAAVKAADPVHIVPHHLPKPPVGRTLVIGAGKAAAVMAQAVENHWPHDAPLAGLVVTRYGHALPTQKIQVIEAGHPIPDGRGMQAAKAILTATRQLTADDLLLCLFSGGGSSLLALPLPPASLRDLQVLTRQLLRCGASIQEINAVRKHLSAIQGGRLAAACRAPILALIISDVTGDDATHIASGPCTPDPTTCADALDVLDRYRLNTPSPVLRILRENHETPKPGAFVFCKVENRIIANSHRSLVAAADYFQTHTLNVQILGDTVTGEAREIAKSQAALTQEIHRYPHTLRAPIALLSGGETTVTVRGNGKGGRNTEFLLSLAIALDGQRDTYAVACDTDGIDGSEDNAGAIITPDSLVRARQQGMHAPHYLARNDTYTFFKQLSDLVITGATHTNVNDYRAIIML